MTEVYNSRFFKADARTHQASPGSKCFHSGSHDNVIVNDFFLSPDTSVTIILEPENMNIIFPIAGKVTLRSEDRDLSPEELFCYCNTTGKALTIRNQFPEETVNFIHISINKDAHRNEHFGSCFSTMGINEKNCMIAAEGAPGAVRVGVYDRRAKDRLILGEGCNSLFSYVINGSFDFEERLMEYRDGLWQSDIAEADFEALSETAIIVLVECSPTKINALESIL